MRPHVLEVKLDALSRSGRGLRELAATVRQAPPSDASTDPAGETPTLLTARSVSTTSLPAIRTAVAERFIRLAERVERTHTAFANADADPAALGTGPTSRPPSAPPEMLT